MEAFCLRASLITAPTLQHFPDQENEGETSEPRGPSKERIGTGLAPRSVQIAAFRRFSIRVSRRVRLNHGSRFAPTKLKPAHAYELSP
jgi:hypothetical protein